MTILEFLKSRSNEAGRKFEMVFSQSEGFDNLLTNLNILNEMKLLKGSPRAYYIEGAEDIKFTWKTFKEKYYDNEILRKAFDSLVKDVMVGFIPQASSSDLEEDEETDINEEDAYTLPDLNDDDVNNSASEDEEEIELVKCVDKSKDIWLASDGNYYTGEGDEVDYTPKKIKK